MTSPTSKIPGVSSDLRVSELPGPTPSVTSAPAQLRAPGEAAIAPLKPGVERLGSAASGGRAGAMGVHPSQLAGFGAEDTIEAVLATPVKIAPPHVVLARLSGLVSEIGARSSIDQVVYRLRERRGATMTLGEAVELVRAADEAGFGGICHGEPLATQIATVAAVLDDDSAALRAATKVAVLEAKPGDAAALRAMLAHDLGEGLDAIASQAPHNPELLADVLRVAKGPERRWLAAKTIEAYGAAAVPTLVKELDGSGDLQAACRSLAKIGRLASGAVDPLWRALEERRGVAGEEASRDRTSILDALAAIGGDRLAAMPNAAAVIEEAYIVDRQNDGDGSAVRIMAAMGDSASRFLGVVTDTNALADIINGMGPAVWAHLPAVLAKRDGDFWWRIMNRAGPPPSGAVVEILRLAREGGPSQALLAPLKDAARAGMAAETRAQVVPFMREQLTSTDARSAGIAYDALLFLLRGEDYQALLLDGLRGTQFRRDALLEIQGKGSKPSEAVTAVLRELLADPATDLWCRMRIRQILAHPAEEIAQEALDHLLVATTFEQSNVYEVARAFGSDRQLETLARLLDAASPGIRLKAAEIMITYVEHRRITPNAIEPLTKLFAVADRDPGLAAVREYPYDEIREDLAKAKG